MKETLYDKDEFKLIDRIVELRKNNPNLKTSDMRRDNEVKEIDIEY